MKNFRKVTIVAAAILVIGATSVTGFAASNYQTPAEALAGLTGQTVESVIAERQESNTTYGTIAAEAGKLNEFKKESLEIKKDNLDAQVTAGKITQEKADTIIKTIEERQIDCDGTGSQGLGQKEGARFGFNGEGQGLGNGQHGQGGGQNGMRLQDGSCYTQAK